MALGLFLILRRYRHSVVGLRIGLLLVGYGLTRFFLEYSRGDALQILGVLTSAQILSIALVIFGAFGLRTTIFRPRLRMHSLNMATRTHRADGNGI